MWYNNTLIDVDISHQDLKMFPLNNKVASYKVPIKNMEISFLGLDQHPSHGQFIIWPKNGKKTVYSVIIKFIYTSVTYISFRSYYIANKTI